MNHTPAKCKVWKGSIDSDGYGRIQIGNKSRLAHRIAWEKEIGPIGEGLQIDHLCRNRPCINVLHMELVTSRENTMRGIGPCAINARKNKCDKGHILSGENLRIRPNGRRECKECSRQRWMKSYYKKREVSNV